MTREEWLKLASRQLCEHVFKGNTLNKEIPPFHVSCGFPSGSGRAFKAIGEAWNATASDDGLAHVFISPIINDSLRVLDILTHEMIHVIDENKSGHKGDFKKMAKAVGLEGKMTATTASEALTEQLKTIVEAIGEYPHSKLNPSATTKKKQTTRMIKLECLNTGYTVRTSRKWINELGAPTCPCCEETMSAMYPKN